MAARSATKSENIESGAFKSRLLIYSLGIFISLCNEEKDSLPLLNCIQSKLGFQVIYKSRMNKLCDAFKAY